MSIQITHTFSTPEEALQHLMDVNGIDPNQGELPEPIGVAQGGIPAFAAEAKAKGKGGRKKAQAAEATAAGFTPPAVPAGIPATPAVATPAAATAPVPSTNGHSLTNEQIKGAVLKWLEGQPNEKAIEISQKLFSHFGGAGVSLSSFSDAQKKALYEHVTNPANAIPPPAPVAPPAAPAAFNPLA